MLAILGAAGKLGFATSSALLNHKLIEKDDLILTTSSQRGIDKLTPLGAQIRHASFDDPESIRTAFKGCSSVLIISSAKISLDFNNAPPGTGRESHHRTAIDAAIEVGVKHIYYTSLAFGRPSKAGVMRAHIRTEEYLESLKDKVDYTIIREGLYNESWPLYLGYYDVPNDNRQDLILAGDGPISWTSIPDLGLGTAMILSAPKSEYAGKTMYLSTARNIKTLSEIADLVGTARGKAMDMKLVDEKEHQDFYVKQKDMPADAVEWWVSSYAALKDKECLISDDTLDRLLKSKGVVPKTMENTIQEMMTTKKT